MSTAGSIPYHLRQNKAIDRNLFVDLLTRMGRFSNISDYRYVGFGGPFLEDFKHFHGALRISKMLSLEIDENVFSRQKFNRPLSTVELIHKSSSDFLNEYDFDTSENFIVWLDYANTDIGTQLAETQRLVEKLGHSDLFKITVNANPASLGDTSDIKEQRRYRAEVARQRLAEYGPAKISEDDVTFKNYPSLLLKALINAAKHGLAGDRNLVVVPLTSFSYSDGQQMLTFTAILLEKKEEESFFQTTRLRHWPFYNGNTETPKAISVPAFSTKERVHIESMLPGATAEEIIGNLNYYIGQNEKSSKTELENFISFYRLFPWYSKVVL